MEVDSTRRRVEMPSANALEGISPQFLLGAGVREEEMDCLVTISIPSF